jgi:pimeloyl-ACP methyl ester carboxylesterase
MVHSSHFDRDIRFGTSSSVLLQDFPDDPDLVMDVVSLVAEDGVASRGVLYRRRGHRAAAAAHLMHPRADHSQNYIALALVKAGFDVLARAGRWVNNDIHAVHETLLLDMAAGVRFLRSERDYSDVVLVGNSGGGTLAAFYQQQAEIAPPGRLRTTPAGDVRDLNAITMPLASALVLIGAHPGEGQVLAKWIDPSVVDESDPLSCDRSLDMYDPGNGYREPPEPSKYSPEFATAYRAAQWARVARLDAWARDKLAEEAESRGAAGTPGLPDEAARRMRRRAVAGWHMVIYRTAADLNFVDLSLDPDDRLPGSVAGGDPHEENYAADGLGRALTPRAWLSTWSGLSSRADTVKCLAGVHVPTLVVHYRGDNGTTLAEARQMHAASAAGDKDLVIVPRLDHYGFPIENGRRARRRSEQGTVAVADWLASRFPG